MSDNKIQFSPEAQRFAIEMEEAKQDVKVPELFSRTGSPREKIDEICILRRWNSHTPSLLNVWGGGYFIRWHNHGTIIDPGCSFIRVFQSEIPYEVGDVDMIISTHDHVDHCQDLGTLISLLREYNKWLDKQNKPPRTWDLLMSHGVANQFNSPLIHPDNSPFLRWNRVLSLDDVEQVQPLPLITREKTRSGMSGWKKHISAYTFFCQKTIAQDYKYQLQLLPTKHKELLGSRTAFGLKFKLKPGGKTIIISGDTGFDDKVNLADYYKNAHLLILHVGTMENTVGERLKDHLGLDGVTKILAGIKRSKPKLVVLTEWGYEFGRIPEPGNLGHRIRFTKLVEERLQTMKIKSYYAPVSNNQIMKKIPIIPADIGLRISLPDLNVWSEDENNGKGGFIPPDRIWVEDKGEELHFHTI